MANSADSEKNHDKTIESVVENEREIEKKLRGQKALRALLENGQLLLQMVVDYFKGRYKQVPYWAIGAAALALLYVLSPVDAIPDVIPVLGYLDDATILAFCIKLIESEIKKYKQWKNTVDVEASEVKS